jgi:hypothetical protein
MNVILATCIFMSTVTQATTSTRLIWPWETKNWPQNKRRVTERITSVVEMDSRISSLCAGRLRPRPISELFTRYYADTPADRVIPQNVFLEQILPHMQRLIEDAPRIFKGFANPPMMPGITQNMALTRPQVATILSCIWFCLFEYNYIEGAKMELFPEPTFLNIFTGQNDTTRMFALQCLLVYFHRVQQYMTTPEVADEFSDGLIIIKRSTAPPVDWSTSVAPLCQVQYGESPADSTPGKVSVVGCHDIIGGELFKGLLSPEEIAMLVRPECLVTTLFCSRLLDYEIITVFGAERMSSYTGLGSAITYAAAVSDETGVGESTDGKILLQHAMVFMDASPRTSGKSQFIDDFARDLHKAYCGFSSVGCDAPIATGHWCCGFNGANVQLKFLQQFLAASQSGHTLVYCAPGRDFEDRLRGFMGYINRNNLTVGQLFMSYIQLLGSIGTKVRLSELDVFECLAHGL